MRLSALRTIPSAGPSLPPRRRVRLFALLAVRNGLRYLPGFFANVAPHVDGIVALDDGSTDETAAYLATRPEVTELLRVPVDRPRWDEPGNHRALVAAAARHGAQWGLAVDADERLEHEFRERAERVIRRGRLLRADAFSVAMRELWDGVDQYRADGRWGRKFVARLFRVRPENEFDPAELHARKTPVGARLLRADLVVYHLGTLTAADRAARRAKYERLDPDSRWQREGYAHLTDDRDLDIRAVHPARGWRE